MRGWFQRAALGCLFFWLFLYGGNERLVWADSPCPNDGDLCWRCIERDNQGACTQWHFYCCDDPIHNLICPAGYYYCTRGCCPVGSVPPTPAPGGGGCIVPTHDNLQVDWNYSATQVRFSWEQLGPLSKQAVYVGNYGEVRANCKSNDLITSNCLIKDENVPVAAAEYLIDRTLFEAGKVYYFKVAGIVVGGCRGNNYTGSMMSCQLSQMEPLALEVGQTRNLTVEIDQTYPNLAYIGRVNFPL